MTNFSNLIRASVAALAVSTLFMAGCSKQASAPIASPTAAAQSADAAPAAAAAEAKAKAEEQAAAAAKLNQPRPATYDAKLVPAKGPNSVTINLGGPAK